MKDGWKIIALLFAGVFLIPALFAVFLIYFSPLVAEPKQPVFGFAGDWRLTNSIGITERPLPPASELWKDYSSWKTDTSSETRLYIARLGGNESQLNFRTWSSTGDTPLGSQRYTNVEFTYRDATNGDYILSWSLRGKHNTDFLKFDSAVRLYQLQIIGNSADLPPKLEIVAIEGIKPSGQ